MAAAFIWAIQTVRLGRHALRFDVNTLARNQIATMALCSAIWLAWSFQVETNPAGNLFAVTTAPLVLLAAVWPGIGPWGIATALQVPPSDFEIVERHLLFFKCFYDVYPALSGRSGHGVPHAIKESL